MIGSYGLKGHIKVNLYLEELRLLKTAELFFVSDFQVKTKINFLKKLKRSIWIAAISETKSKEQAEKLKGRHVFLEKKFLPTLTTEEFYYEDLKGLKIIIDGSMQKGFVKNVTNFGSGDVLEVSLDARETTIYVPFDKDNVSSIDLASSTIMLTPLKGIFN